MWYFRKSCSETTFKVAIWVRKKNFVNTKSHTIVRRSFLHRKNVVFDVCKFAAVKFIIGREFERNWQKLRKSLTNIGNNKEQTPVVLHLLSR